MHPPPIVRIHNPPPRRPLVWRRPAERGFAAVVKEIHRTRFCIGLENGRPRAGATRHF